MPTSTHRRRQSKTTREQIRRIFPPPVDFDSQRRKTRLLLATAAVLEIRSPCRRRRAAVLHGSSPSKHDASIRTETSNDRSRHAVRCALVVVFIAVDNLRPFRFVICRRRVTIARSSDRDDPRNGVPATTRQSSSSFRPCPFCGLALT